MLNCSFVFVFIQRFEEQQNKKEDEIGKLQQDNLSLAGVTLAVDDALKDANVNVYERKNIIDQQSEKNRNLFVDV